MQYSLNEKPPLSALLVYGMQWFVVSLPSSVITGMIVAKMHNYSVTQQNAYLQLVFIAVGITTIAQVLWGHRLPLILGPASTLLIGIAASLANSPAQIYTAIAIGGVLVSVLAASGGLDRIHGIFSPRVIVVILLLVAVNLIPVIAQLIFSAGKGFSNLLFSLLFVIALTALNAVLQGVWKATTLVWGLVGGTLVYGLVTGMPFAPDIAGFSLPSFMPIGFEFDAGVIIAFLFCFVGLLVNELGSIEAVGHFLEADDMSGRVRRGVTGIGLSNAVSGSLGVIGFVDFSMSTGIIAATQCASRYTLIPAGGLLILCSLIPGVVSVLTSIPTVVMGAMLLYIMSSQLAAGLILIVRQKCLETFNDSLVIALPVMVALLVSGLPDDVLMAVPDILRSIIGNGFVMGVVVVLILEHGILRKKRGV